MKARIPYSILLRFLKNAKRIATPSKINPAAWLVAVEVQGTNGTIHQSGGSGVDYVQNFPMTYNPDGSRGRVVLDRNKLGALMPTKVKKAERDRIVVLEEINGTITVFWGGQALGSFAAGCSEDFPPTPRTCNVVDRPVTYLKSDVLDALVAVSGAASVDPCRLNLINVQMTLEGSQCTFVATDGYRIHIVQTAAVSFGEHGPGARKYLIGAETISILKSLTGGERNVTFDYQDLEDGGMITYFGWGSGFIICRMGSVTYPEYREILKIGQEGQIVADRASLLDAVEGFCRAARAEKGSGMVTVELNGSIKISGVFGTTAICRDIPYRAKAGPDVTIGLNCDYLREALGLLTSETVTLDFTDPLTQCNGVVIRDNKSARIALVMPMRL